MTPSQSYQTDRHNRLVKAMGNFMVYYNNVYNDKVKSDYNNLRRWEREVNKLLKEELEQRNQLTVFENISHGS